MYKDTCIQVYVYKAHTQTHTNYTTLVSPIQKQSHVCTYTNTHTHKLQVYMYTCIYTQTHTNYTTFVSPIQKQSPVCTYSNTHTHTHTDKRSNGAAREGRQHTYIHTYIHTHTQTAPFS
jgi:hypothetical protein